MLRTERHTRTIILSRPKQYIKFSVIYRFPDLHSDSHARAIHHSKSAPDCLRPRLPATSAVAGTFAETQATLTPVPVQSTCICHPTWYFHPNVSGATGHCTVCMAVRGSYYPRQHVFGKISSARAEKFRELMRIAGGNAVVTSSHMALESIESIQFGIIRLTRDRRHDL